MPSIPAPPLTEVGRPVVYILQTPAPPATPPAPVREGLSGFAEPSGVASPASASHHAAPPPAPTSEALSLWQVVTAQFLGGLVIAVVSILLAASVLGRSVRRQLEAAAVRVEFVNGPPLARHADADPPTARRSPAPPPAAVDAGPGRQADEAAPALRQELRKRFDPGLTFEQNQQQLEEARRPPNDAVLRQILEQNLALRRRLAQSRRDFSSVCGTDGDEQPCDEQP
jgi:hypothetical protein